MSTDLTEITHLYARYSISIDAMDLEALRGCFTTEGSMEIVDGPTFAGAEGLAQVVANRTTRSPRHETSNVVADVAGDQATGRAYFVLRGPDGAPAAMGDYLDELVRTETGWRFEARRITFAWRA